MPTRKAARSRCSARAASGCATCRLQTSAELLKSFVKEVPRPQHLCTEEGTLNEWLYEELTPVVTSWWRCYPTAALGTTCNPALTSTGRASPRLKPFRSVQNQ